MGSQFVQQYYTVLHTSPKYLHRFYTDASAMTHTDGSETFTASNQKVGLPHLSKSRSGVDVGAAAACSPGKCTSAPPGMAQNIHDKVTELEFEEAATEIWGVDSQYSIEGGVIVQVVGALQIKVLTAFLDLIKGFS